MAGPASMWLLGYLVNSAWQVCVLAVAGALAARLAARTGPAVVHRVWVAALLGAAVLPARGWALPDLWPGTSGSGGTVRTAMGASTTAAGGHVLQVAPWLACAMLACWAAGTVFAVARLVWGLGQVRRLVGAARGLSAAEDAALGREAERSRMGLRVRMCDGLAGPFVVGWRRPMLLLPAGFCDETEARDRAAALAHEMAHVERRDYAKNLLWSLLSLPVAYHPGVRMMRAQLTESREMACDAMAAQSAGSARGYAQALLRLAEQRPRALQGTAGPAVGIFDGRSLERRITTMMHEQKQLRGMARAAVLGALTLFAAGAGMATAAARMDVGAAAAAKPVTLTVKGSVMAGNIVSKPAPVYPPEAKAARQQGTVTLAAVINTQGNIEHLKVLHSAGKALDRSAIDAVKQWHYKPYLLNGEPVTVDTNINVTYTLADPKK